MLTISISDHPLSPYAVYSLCLFTNHPVYIHYSVVLVKEHPQVFGCIYSHLNLWQSCTWIPEKLQLVQQPSCVGAGWISQPINYIRI